MNIAIELLPRKALSIRQPWAWAIVAGHKDIENRTGFAVKKGKFSVGNFCVHAALGMTAAEYDRAATFMRGLGVECPPPAELIRGGIIGTARLVDIAPLSDSPWYFRQTGNRALVLADAKPLDFIPVSGALGFFDWRNAINSGGLPDPAKPWMLNAQALPDDGTAVRPDGRQPMPTRDQMELFVKGAS